MERSIAQSKTPIHVAELFKGVSVALIKCEECKQDISDTVKACPHCGHAVKKKMSVAQWIGIVVVALFVIGLMAGGSKDGQGGSGGATSAATSTQAPPMDVDIRELLDAYKSNEVGADNSYKNKRIRVSGTVSAIKKDITDSLYVTIGTGKQFEIPEVQASFDDSKNDQLAKLKKGQIVTVVCRIQGLMLNVQAKDCDLE